MSRIGNRVYRPSRFVAGAVRWALWIAAVPLVAGVAGSAGRTADLVAAELEIRATGVLAAAEAHQAAAADERFVYAIDSVKVVRYDRTSGERLATSTGEARHLNSGFLWQGSLYCAHSNYPQKPESSQIKRLDLATMRLDTWKDFGDFGGSLTWVVRRGPHWYCNFAYYGDENARTTLVRFDQQWRELARWTYPVEMIRELGRYSVSGAVWWDDSLLATDHDHGVLYQLRLPADGGVLQLVDRLPAPFTGQGIARDLKTGGLIGIDRAKRQLVFAQVETPAPTPRLPRDRLLVYRTADGGQAPATTGDDWRRRRREIVRGMQTVMGTLPGEEKRCELDVEVVEEVDCGSYVRRLIQYSSEPGSRTPAYLCIPKTALVPGAKPTPAVLCLHGTDNVTGHGTVVGVGGKPNRQYASELAERGYVTLSPNYPILAKYQPDVLGLGWHSGTLKAVWDNIRGLDLLDSLPYVRPGAYGAIGHSLGGHNAVYTSVLDERVKTVVSSCGLDSYLDYIGGDEKVWMPGKGWTQTRYMPRMADYRGRLAEIPFDFHELIGALAPRDVLIVAPLHDSNFQWQSVDRIAAAASDVYRLLGAPQALAVEHPDCPHDFPEPMRLKAYALFDRTLR